MNILFVEKLKDDFRKPDDIQVVVLTPEVMAALDEAAPKGAAAGDRYPESAMRSVNI